MRAGAHHTRMQPAPVQRRRLSGASHSLHPHSFDSGFRIDRRSSSRSSSVHISRFEWHWLCGEVHWFSKNCVCACLCGGIAKMRVVEELVHEYMELTNTISADLAMNTSTLNAAAGMASATNNSLLKFYHRVFWEFSDPRTRDWFLLASPIPGVGIMIAYLYFVISWGPRHMEHRKPFVLKNTLVIYNFIQVLLSAWLFYEGLDGAWLRHYSWKCQPVDFSNSPTALRVARGVYIYFLAKLTELLDTVFFVLRKKDRQITFLHMYHHTVMPMISWGAAKYYPGGHGTFIGVINSFVHIIMYTYYMLAAAGPQYQKYLWWKKYITTLQMAQFCLAFIHSFQLLIYDCDYPRWSLIFILPNAIFFYFLFSEFYNKAYTPEQVAAAKKKKDDDDEAKKFKSMNGKASNGFSQNGKAIVNGEVILNGKMIANGKSIIENGKSKSA